jgi:hypothetical protein
LSGAVAKPASINLQKLVLSPTGSINLGFILRGDLLLCSSYLPLGVPNWAANTALSNTTLQSSIGGSGNNHSPKVRRKRSGNHQRMGRLKKVTMLALSHAILSMSTKDKRTEEEYPPQQENLIVNKRYTH